jgi:hypothetical protein
MLEKSACNGPDSAVVEIVKNSALVARFQAILGARRS